MIKGLDVASVDGNKNPDWTKAKEAGFSFAIPRAAYGTSKDAIFDVEWVKLKIAGYVRGGYLFLRFPRDGKSVPSPTAQAEALCKIVGQLTPDCYPPTIDLEFPGGASATDMTPTQLITGFVDAWDVLATFYGVAPMIYTSARVIREDLHNLPFPNRVLDSPLWLARYYYNSGPAVINPPEQMAPPPVPPQWGDVDAWWLHQYQGDATGVPGFTNTVDLNRFNTMSRGAVGTRVKWVQRRLKLTGAAVDGKFGPATEAALRKFQTAKGLVSDGMIGPKTFAYLCWVK